jgi:hypothetical protein
MWSSAWKILDGNSNMSLRSTLFVWIILWYILCLRKYKENVGLLVYMSKVCITCSVLLHLKNMQSKLKGRLRDANF